jgi:heparin binding hemagglutinin HbhA
MAIQLPTSADVRKARSQVNKAVNTQVDAVRRPVMAWLGATDLAVQTLRELPEELRTRLSRDELRKRADEAGERARGTYNDWAERGEDTLERIRIQPQVARALRSVESANKRSNSLVENLVDELHDVGSEVLEAVSFETRSAGERTARRTQRVARDTAKAVTEVSAEFAEAVTDAADEAAHTTRSATRKAANRTAPAKSTPAKSAPAKSAPAEQPKTNNGARRTTANK